MTIKTFVQGLFIIWSVIFPQVHLDKINAPGCGVAPPHPRIYNGRKIHRRFVPWMVQIVSYYGPGHEALSARGGGSLISECYVLTAAHVIRDKISLAKKVTLRFNATYLFDPPAVIAEELIPHPRYNVTTTQNDIALVKLPYPVRFDKFVKPICLPTHRLRLNNRKAFFAGWGATTDVDKPSLWLYFVALKILPFRLCPRSTDSSEQEDYFTKGGIICTKSRGKNVCRGDSGGPLVVWNKRRHRFVEVGIGSFQNHYSCVNATQPDVFTRISTFVPWIRKVIAGHRRHRNYGTTSTVECAQSMYN